MREPWKAGHLHLAQQVIEQQLTSTPKGALISSAGTDQQAVYAEKLPHRWTS